MTHVNCRLTGKNQDQLRNPTLGNRVWATFLAAVLEGTWLLPAYGSLVTVAVVYETRSIVTVAEETWILPALESLALVSVVWASSTLRS